MPPTPYQIDEGRIVVSTGGDARCPVGCGYCYTYAKDFVSFPVRSAEQVVADLQGMSNRIDLIQLGCDTELFWDARHGIDVVRAVASLRKDVSFATKMRLDPQGIGELARISEQLQRPEYFSRTNSRNLVAFVSLIGFEAARKLEPRAASPEERVGMIKDLHASGIPTFVYMRPMLPQIPTDELERVFERTAGHCDGYVMGKFYFDKPGVAKWGVAKASKQQMAWGLDRREWSIYLDERIAEFSARHKVFLSSEDAVSAVRGRQFQDAVAVSWDAESPRVQSLRATIPYAVTDLTLLHRDDAGLLSLDRDVFTGGVYTVPDENRTPLVFRAPENFMGGIPFHLVLQDGRLFSAPMLGSAYARESVRKLMLDPLLLRVKNPDELREYSRQLGFRYDPLT